MFKGETNKGEWTSETDKDPDKQHISLRQQRTGGGGEKREDVHTEALFFPNESTARNTDGFHFPGKSIAASNEKKIQIKLHAKAPSFALHQNRPIEFFFIPTNKPTLEIFFNKRVRGRESLPNVTGILTLLIHTVIFPQPLFRKTWMRNSIPLIGNVTQVGRISLMYNR